MKRINLIPLVFFSLLVLHACDKDDSADKSDLLAGTSWQINLTDDNPDTNPQGEVVYFTWSDCHSDDIFKFQNGKLAIDDNGTACEESTDLIFSSTVRPYSFDYQSKKLKIGAGEESIDFQVLELNWSRLKLAIPITDASRSNLVFLFKKK